MEEETNDIVSPDSEDTVPYEEVASADAVRDKPVNADDGMKVTRANAQTLFLYPTWRSQILRLALFLIFCILAVVASEYVSVSIINGPLFAIGEIELRLHLPLFFFLPAYVLGLVLYSMYNSRYIIDERGVEAQIGLVALSLRQPRLRYEDIRGVEPKQTLWERILGIGSLHVGSAMTFEVEIEMMGIASPRAVQLLINRERDKHLRWLRRHGETNIALSGD